MISNSNSASSGELESKLPERLTEGLHPGHEYIKEHFSAYLIELNHYGKAKAVGDAIHVMDGRIVDILPSDTPVPSGAEILDAENRVVLPAFVDPHTHVVFAGTREDEFNMRLQGKTYMEIAEAGGGINSTVRQTRAAGEDDLYRQSSENLNRMIAHGIAMGATRGASNCC